MEQLINILGDDRVSVASVEKDNRGRNPGLDKEQVKKQLEVKNQMGEVAKELEGKSREERIDWLDSKKSKADELYKSSDFGEALKIYLEALMGLSDEVLGSDVVKEYKIKICMNMAMCSLESKNAPKAMSLINQAIQVNVNYWKSHLKKGIIYERMEEYDDAVYVDRN